MGETPIDYADVLRRLDGNHERTQPLAADAIRALVAENARLREALQKLTEASRFFVTEIDRYSSTTERRMFVAHEHARKALNHD